MSLEESIRLQIEFAANQEVACERNGDFDSVEAWRGYALALRWVLESAIPASRGEQGR